MKQRGPHPHHKLSSVAVKALKKPGRYSDGNGLYLVVSNTGSKKWILRTMVPDATKESGTRRTDIGLGGLSLVSLKEAREEAIRLRKVARDGEDPLEQRRMERVVVPTFKEAATRVHAEHSKTWKNKKHAAQWINTLTEYAFPQFGSMPIDHVGTADVLNALSPIWLVKPETARRVRQRIGTVMDWARTAGHRTGDNPINGIQKGLPKQPKKQGHHAALPYTEVKTFISALDQIDANESTRLAFEFLILTAARTSEVIRGEWSEIDIDEKSWTIPAERMMKTDRIHRVPLSPRCIEILGRARQLSDNGPFIFPGRSTRKPLSTMVFLMVIRRMKKDVTTHGFRSTFRDWAAEKTNFSREVCEMAMSHTVKDKTEAAYFRGDLFDKRRDLMDTWASYACADKSDKVVAIRQSSA